MAKVQAYVSDEIVYKIKLWKEDVQKELKVQM